MNKTTRNSLLLVLTAFIWGVAFVGQSAGGDAVGPFTFNCVRSILGAGALCVGMRPLDALGLTKTSQRGGEPMTDAEKRTLLIGGICCGLCLGIASNLQQLGITAGDSVGKAGFLTTTYILLVPILGIGLGRRCSWNVWIGVFMTLIGLYLLCMKSGASLQLQLSDVLVLACALGFSFHILVIDHFSPMVDGVRMSAIQFLVAAAISAIPMVLTEVRPWDGGVAGWLASFMTTGAWISILYVGICSSGIAYTLQIIGQEDVNPTVASLLMSLESVFSVVAGALFLKEYMSVRELFGCLLIFIAVVFAQIPVKKLHIKKK